MVAVERTFTVARPIDTVVDYLRDFGHAEAWDPGTKTCTRNDSGPIIVGSSWHNVSEFRGKETELAYRLDRAEADHLTFIGENKSAHSVDDMSFASAGPDSTTVTYRATITFKGLAKLADPFMKPVFAKLGVQTEEQMTGVFATL